MLLLGGITSYGQSGGGFNPGNPPEPNALYDLSVQVSPKGSGSVSGAGKYAEGASVRVSASANSGFRFIAWKKGDVVISDASAFYYTIPAENSTLTAVYEYDPNSPGEPPVIVIPKKSKIYLEALPTNGGSFNQTSGNSYNSGTSVYLYAYTNTGFRFVEWREEETVLSTSVGFYYPIGDTDKTLKAVFRYDPNNPGEPNVPQGIEHGLIALTQYGDGGQTIAYPIYLLNHNIDVYSVEFDIQFPEGAIVDYQNAVLTNRGNGHQILSEALADNTFHYSITNEINAGVFDSNGILINIPVTLPNSWNSEETYPVQIENIILGTPAGTIPSSGNNGALKMNETSGYEVLADFYANKFLNRVYFINLSSETATGFLWDFGDGTAGSAEKNPMHVYESGGSYEVKLIASDGYHSDTTLITTEINPENTWSISGTISLNKHKKEVKNFTSLEELFVLLSRSYISGNITVDVEAGETFDFLMSPETNTILSIIKDKLAATGSKLIFRKSGSTANPVIDFPGEANPIFFKTIIQWNQYIETNQVEIRIFGQPVNLNRIAGYTQQKVCSGTNSETIDFTEIGDSFTYSWSLIATPVRTSGYGVEGINAIPAMPLINNSQVADTLKYKISMMFPSPAIELYSFEYKIVTIPNIQGEIHILSPEEDRILDNSTVTITWSQVVNAAFYELKVWEEYDDEPAESNVTRLTETSYQSSALFRYGKTYHIRVIAVNECKQIESEAVSFQIRNLPNLHVTSLQSVASVDADEEIEVIYSVKNEGPGDILATEYWYDQIALIRDLQHPNTSAYWLSSKQNKKALAAGETYIDTITTRIPDRLSGEYFLVVASDMTNIVSIDWSPAGNVVPVPYTPSMNGIPYHFLQAQTNPSGNRILEDRETNTLTDNFFYSPIIITVPQLPDLQVTAIEIPDEVTESHAFTAIATITNTGNNTISGKTWTDAIWRSRTSGFDQATATLVTTKSANHTLEKNDFYTVGFDLTAPIDSLTDYYYFVTTDINDNVYESNETNNRFRSHAVKILPYAMADDDYARLVAFYNELDGANWTNRWNTATPRIGNYWTGVTFENGWVTAIDLPSNQLTGALSETILAFPHLTSLNLYNNQISGHLTDLFSGEIRPDSLISLNLGKNQLSGAIPASVSDWIYLENLNLSYNRLTTMESALPATVVQLDLQCQSLDTDSIALSPHAQFQIPSIAQYNHANKSFDFHPSYALYASNKYILRYYPEGNGYNWTLPTNIARDFEWKYASGTEFTLVQETGLTYGSSNSLKITFASGDANIDQEVNILDVQHSLNYIFNEHVAAFNFTAADTYQDNIINIQDLIKTINIILDSNMHGKRSLRALSGTENRLYIEDGKLILYTGEPIAAMDITLQGISEQEIMPALNQTQFQYMKRQLEPQVRMILFSPTGNNILPGRTVIAELQNKDANLVSAMASDPEAKSIPIELAVSSPTSVVSPDTEDINVFVKDGILHYYLPEKADKIIATLYSVQGKIISKQEITDIQAGQHILNFHASSGIYILNFTIKLNGQNISKNSKLII
jgi:PKD repeat protein